jgi:hypothetical protein
MLPYPIDSPKSRIVKLCNYSVPLRLAATLSAFYEAWSRLPSQKPTTRWKTLTMATTHTRSCEVTKLFRVRFIIPLRL